MFIHAINWRDVYLLKERIYQHKNSILIKTLKEYCHFIAIKNMVTERMCDCGEAMSLCKKCWPRFRQRLVLLCMLRDECRNYIHYITYIFGCTALVEPFLSLYCIGVIYFDTYCITNTCRQHEKPACD